MVTVCNENVGGKVETVLPRATQEGGYLHPGDTALFPLYPSSTQAVFMQRCMCFSEYARVL